MKVHKEILCLLVLAVSCIGLEGHLHAASQAKSAIKKMAKAVKKKFVGTGNKETLLGAAANGDKQLVEKYLAKKSADVNKQNEKGVTPLHAAAYQGHEDIVEMLLKHGAKVNLQDKIKGEAPLIMSVIKGHEGISQALLEHGAEVNKQNEKGIAALHAAAYIGHKDIVEMLLKHGANVNIQDKIKGETPLIMSVIKGHEDVFQDLLAHGADVNIYDNHRNTVLHWAIKGDRVEMAKKLIDSGIDVNKQNKDGNTALHLAAYFDQEDIVKGLLVKVADKSLLNNEKKTPLVVAKSRGSKKALSILENVPPIAVFSLKQKLIDMVKNPQSKIKVPACYPKLLLQSNKKKLQAKLEEAVKAKGLNKAEQQVSK